MKLAYTAFDKSGKSVAATIEAEAPAEAKEMLRRRGLFVTQIGEDHGEPLVDPPAALRPRAVKPANSLAAGGVVPAGRAGKKPRPGGVKRQRIGAGKRLHNLAMFSRQLFVLVNSGVPLVESLVAIERQTKDAPWKAVVTHVREKVETGSTLSDALSQHADHFNAVFRSLVSAGESSGKLPAMLERLSILCRKQLHVRSSVMGAMIYPAVLMTVAGGVLMVMMIFVLPRFADLFKTLGAPLPATTQFLMYISDAVVHYWWAMPFIVGGAVWGGWAWANSRGGTRALQTFAIKVPRFGVIVRSFATARIARLLGILMDSHVPLIDAIQLTRDSVGNHHYKRLLDKAEDAVTRGEPISVAFADEKLINASVYEAVRNGEKSGQMGSMLLNIADYLEEENEVVVKSLTTLIEPLILIVLGIVVGFVAISMFLPLFDLTSTIGGGK